MKTNRSREVKVVCSFIFIGILFWILIIFGIFNVKSIIVPLIYIINGIYFAVEALSPKEKMIQIILSSAIIILLGIVPYVILIM